MALETLRPEEQAWLLIQRSLARAMAKLAAEGTTGPGVRIIEPRVFGDARGFFLETFQADRYRQEAGIDLPFVQDNHSRSCRGVLRGLHSQSPHPQGKLVRVARGEVFDVAVDIDPASSTFGKWTGVVLSEANHLQLWIPPGYAHGFVVLSDIADFEYWISKKVWPAGNLQAMDVSKIKNYDKIVGIFKSGKLTPDSEIAQGTAPHSVGFVEGVDGGWRRYRVVRTFVTHERDMRVLAGTGAPRLTLVTCWPFDAVFPGGSERYVVVADAEG